MADYSKQIRQALRQIERRGEMCVYVRYLVPLPDSPWEATPDTPTRANLFMFFTPAGQQTAYRSGTLVGRGGYVGFLGNHGFEPSLKDWVIRGREHLTVKDFLAIKLNEQPIYYQLTLNR